MDKTAETLIDVSGFISEYSAHMMGCGVHTSRVIRSANRCLLYTSDAADDRISVDLGGRRRI